MKLLALLLLPLCLPGQMLQGIVADTHQSTGAACTPASGYSHCRLLTIDHTKVGSVDQTNFAVLVSATLGSSRIQNANCYDMVFTSDSGGTALIPWEQDLCTQSTGVILDWVKVATVSHTVDTVFYVSYGNAGISTAQNTGGAAPTAVWSADYVGAWHLRDGSTLTLTDSTATGLTLTNNNTATAGAGKVDGAAALANASSQYLSVSNAALGTVAMSYAVWAKATSFPNSRNTAIGQDDGTFASLIMVRDDTQLNMYITATGGAKSYSGGTAFLSTGTWYYLVLSYSDATGLVGYVNTTADGTDVSGGVHTFPATPVLAVGEDIPNAPRYWDGILDEPRQLNVAVTADWVTATYNNQSSPTTFVTVGTEI